MTPMTPATFRAAFPQFQDEPLDPVIQSAIDLSNLYIVNPAVYGELYPRAQGLLVAHMLLYSFDTSNGLDPRANDATREKRATLDVARDPKLLQMQAMSDLFATWAGKQFWDLRRAAGSGGMAA